MKKRQILFFKRFILLLIIFVVSGYSFSEEQMVLPLATVHWPPYEMEESEDGLKGFDYEVVKASFGRAGVDTEIEFLPWNRARELTRLGKKAAIFSVAKNKEREGYMLFSDRLSSTTWGVYSLKSTPLNSVNSIEDLRGKDVATLLGWKMHKQLLAIGITPRTYTSEEKALKNLLAGRYTYLHVTKESSAYIAAKMGAFDRLRFQQTRQIHVFIGISKKWQGAAELVKKFNWGLQQLKEDGTYEKIHAKYQ